MKKVMSIVLVLGLVLSLFAGCGSSEPAQTTEGAASVEGTMEELLGKILEQQPVEFAGYTTVLDLADTSEEGKWALKSFTGLSGTELVSEAAAYEPMINAMAFSLVLARKSDTADTKALAENMKVGVDPRKWICVEADDMKVAGFADVVLLIMVDSNSDMTAQSFVDAFAAVTGMEPDFVL